MGNRWWGEVAVDSNAANVEDGGRQWEEGRGWRRETSGGRRWLVDDGRWPIAAGGERRREEGSRRCKRWPVDDGWQPTAVGGGRWVAVKGGWQREERGRWWETVVGDRRRVVVGGVWPTVEDGGWWREASGVERRVARGRSGGQWMVGDSLRRPTLGCGQRLKAGGYERREADGRRV